MMRIVLITVVVTCFVQIIKTQDSEIEWLPYVPDKIVENITTDLKFLREKIDTCINPQSERDQENAIKKAISEPLKQLVSTISAECISSVNILWNQLKKEQENFKKELIASVKDIIGQEFKDMETKMSKTRNDEMAFLREDIVRIKQSIENVNDKKFSFVQSDIGNIKQIVKEQKDVFNLLRKDVEGIKQAMANENNILDLLKTETYQIKNKILAQNANIESMRNNINEGKQLLKDEINLIKSLHQDNKQNILVGKDEFKLLFEDNKKIIDTIETNSIDFLLKNTAQVEKLTSEGKESLRVLQNDNRDLKNLITNHNRDFKNLIKNDNEIVKIIQKDVGYIKQITINGFNDVQSIQKNVEEIKKSVQSENEAIKSIQKDMSYIKQVGDDENNGIAALRKDNDQIKNLLIDDKHLIGAMQNDTEQIKQIVANENESIKLIQQNLNQIVQNNGREDNIIKFLQNETIEIKKIVKDENDAIKLLQKNSEEIKSRILNEKNVIIDKVETDANTNINNNINSNNLIDLLDNIANKDFNTADPKIKLLKEAKEIKFVIKSAYEGKTTNFVPLLEVCRLVDSGKKFLAYDALGSEIESYNQMSMDILQKLTDEIETQILNEDGLKLILKLKNNYIVPIVSAKFNEKQDVKNVVEFIQSFGKIDMKILAYKALYEFMKDNNIENTYLILLANNLKDIMRDASYKKLNNVYWQITESVKNSLPGCIKTAVFLSPILIFTGNNKTLDRSYVLDFPKNSINFGIFDTANPRNYYYVTDSVTTYKGVKGRNLHFYHKREITQNALWNLEQKGEYCHIRNVKYDEYLHIRLDYLNYWFTKSGITNDNLNTANLYFKPFFKSY